MFTVGLGSRGNPSRRKRLREKWDPSDVQEERRRNSQNERAVNRLPGKGVSECVWRSPGASLTRAEKVRLRGQSETSFRVSKDAQDLKQFSKPGIDTQWGFKGKVLCGWQAVQGRCLSRRFVFTSRTDAAPTQTEKRHGAHQNQHFNYVKFDGFKLAH